MSVPRCIDAHRRKSSASNIPTLRIPQSFKASYVENQSHLNDDNFFMGDFSARHLNNHTNIMDPRIFNNNEDEPSSSRAVVVQGGFEEIDTGIVHNDELSKSITARKPSAFGQSNQLSNASSRNELRPKIDTSNGTDGNQLANPQNQNQNVIAPQLQPKASNKSLQDNRSIHIDVDIENPDSKVVDVVERHLVNPQQSREASIFSVEGSRSQTPKIPYDDEFDSLQLQSGDMTRDLYNWTKNQRSQSPLKRSSSFSNSRSSSFVGSRSDIGLEGGSRVNDMRMPGGFRRSFLHQKRITQLNDPNAAPNFFTNNFIEFLTLYGHFAGEELDDEDEDEEEDAEYEDNDVFDAGTNEETRLLQPRHTAQRREPERTVTTAKATMLLLKAFVGTGVLFLPKGFYNGGLGLSSFLLIFFSVLSFWCFTILIEARVVTNISSYGDIGEFLFGKSMRKSILTSIVLSQIGFAAAYIIFVATNLQALVHNVFDKSYSIEVFIIFQLAIFIPLSLTRKIEKLSFTALIADLFILLGLLYVYYYSTYTVLKHGISDIQYINESSWTLFVGTAIFTNEAIGLLIPIQESMKHPSQFKPTLLAVMVCVTLIFVTVGSICYLAFGSKVQTVIILNFPQDSVLVNIVQLLYALAILLSTPLQLFPAIKILENGIFKRSGKNNTTIKWSKNYFRVAVVLLTAFISYGGANDLDKFVSLIGSFTCVPLIYLYPPLLHLKSCQLSPLVKTIDILVLILGVVMMVYTSFDTIIHWV